MLAQDTHDWSRWNEVTRNWPAPGRDRTLAMFLGGAVGDALGAPVEFLKREAILSQFGELPPRELALLAPRDENGNLANDAPWPPQAPFTDDTQMTLFVAEGIIRAVQRGRRKGMCHPPGVIAWALLRWLVTQEGKGAVSGAANNDLLDIGWLIKDRRLHVQRAPGMTCLKGLREAPRRVNMCVAENTSKGAGTIMRTAPCALLNSPSDAYRLALEQSAITHGHLTGQFAAGAFTLVLWALLRGQDVSTGYQLAQQATADQRGGEETLEALREGFAVGISGEVSSRHFDSWGGGWTAESALAIAMACVGRASNRSRVPETLWLAASHDGDSDTTASLVGQIIGADLGLHAFPEEYLDQLEAGDLVLRMASDLHDATVLNTPILWPMYPGA